MTGWSLGPEEMAALGALVTAVWHIGIGQEYTLAVIALGPGIRKFQMQKLASGACARYEVETMKIRRP